MGSPSRGRRRGKLMPMPMAGDPEMAPMMRGTTTSTARRGTPEPSMDWKRLVTLPEASMMSLR